MLEANTPLAGQKGMHTLPPCSCGSSTVRLYSRCSEQLRNSELRRPWRPERCLRRPMCWIDRKPAATPVEKKCKRCKYDCKLPHLFPVPLLAVVHVDCVVSDAQSPVQRGRSCPCGCVIQISCRGINSKGYARIAPITSADGLGGISILSFILLVI